MFSTFVCPVPSLQKNQSLPLTESTSKLLQHKILQICNELISYKTSLQVLGVICISIDSGKEEILVKINNTLERIVPAHNNNSIKIDNAAKLLTKYGNNSVHDLSLDKDKMQPKRLHHGRKQTHPNRLITPEATNEQNSLKESRRMNNPEAAIEHNLIKESTNMDQSFNPNTASEHNPSKESDQLNCIPILSSSKHIDNSVSKNSNSSSDCGYSNADERSLEANILKNSEEYSDNKSSENIHANGDAGLVGTSAVIADYPAQRLDLYSSKIEDGSADVSCNSENLNNRCKDINIRKPSSRQLEHKMHNVDRLINDLLDNDDANESSNNSFGDDIAVESALNNSDSERPSTSELMGNSRGDSVSQPLVKRRLLDVLKNKKYCDGEKDNCYNNHCLLNGDSDTEPNNCYEFSAKDFVITNNENNLRSDSIKTFFSSIPSDTHYLIDNNSPDLINFNRDNPNGIASGSNNPLYAGYLHNRLLFCNDNKSALNGLSTFGIGNLEKYLGRSSNFSGKSVVNEPNCGKNDDDLMVGETCNDAVKIKEEADDYNDGDGCVLNLSKPGKTINPVRNAIDQLADKKSFKSIKLKDLITDKPNLNSAVQFLNGWNFLNSAQTADLQNTIFSTDHYQKMATPFKKKKAGLISSYGLLTPKKAETSPSSIAPSPGLENEYLLDSFSVGVNGSSPLVSSVSKNVRRSRKRQTEDSLSTEEIAEYVGCNDSKSQALFSQYKCLYCGEMCENLSSYFRHTLTTHGAFICHECGKNFTTKSSLLRHRPIHTGMRRFTCSICKKSFYRKDKCKAHIKRHLELAHAAKEAEKDDDFGGHRGVTYGGDYNAYRYEDGGAVAPADTSSNLNGAAGEVTDNDLKYRVGYNSALNGAGNDSDVRSNKQQRDVMMGGGLNFKLASQLVNSPAIKNMRLGGLNNFGISSLIGAGGQLGREKTVSPLLIRGLANNFGGLGCAELPPKIHSPSENLRVVSSPETP